MAAPDPNMLYVVTAIVVTALVAWVVVVLLRAPSREPGATIVNPPQPSGTLDAEKKPTA